MRFGLTCHLSCAKSARSSFLMLDAPAASVASPLGPAPCKKSSSGVEGVPVEHVPVTRSTQAPFEHWPALGPKPAPRAFFFNDRATTEIYTLSLHDALRAG